MKITSESRQTSFQYTQQLNVVKRLYHKPSFSDCHCCSLSLFFLDRCQNTFSSADLDFLPSSFNCHWRCHCGDFQAFLKLKYCLDISTRTCLRRRNFCWTILLYSNSSVAFFSIPSLSLSLVEIDEEQDEDWGKKFKRYQKKKFCRVLLLLPRTVWM